jgi:hypothetical protein
MREHSPLIELDTLKPRPPLLHSRLRREGVNPAHNGGPKKRRATVVGVGRIGESRSIFCGRLAFFCVLGVVHSPWLFLSDLCIYKAWEGAR